MQLLLVRHAEAVDLGGAVTSDADRHLTPRGQATAHKLADTLRGRVSLEAVVSSPFARAVQTAEPLLALAPAGAVLVLCPELVPMAQDAKGVAGAVAALGVRSAAVVGHLPDIAVFAAWLIGGGEVSFDRGSAALLDVDGRLGPGCGAVRWLLTPEWYC
jgi:phosphohistidine phosphatase